MEDDAFVGTIVVLAALILMILIVIAIIKAVT